MYRLLLVEDEWSTRMDRENLALIRMKNEIEAAVAVIGDGDWYAQHKQRGPPEGVILAAGEPLVNVMKQLSELKSMT
jgi:hypothetical protein